MKVGDSIPQVYYFIACNSGGRLKVRLPQRRKLCFISTVSFISSVFLFNPLMCFDLSYCHITTESSDVG